MAKKKTKAKRAKKAARRKPAKKVTRRARTSSATSSTSKNGAPGIATRAMDVLRAWSPTRYTGR